MAKVCALLSAVLVDNVSACAEGVAGSRRQFADASGAFAARLSALPPDAGSSVCSGRGGGGGVRWSSAAVGAGLCRRVAGLLRGGRADRHPGHCRAQVRPGRRRRRPLRGDVLWARARHQASAGRREVPLPVPLVLRGSL